jgi:addiction module RelE/StbE family toxin
MLKHQINITELAEQDLNEIIDYISADSITAALQIADMIEQNIAKLEDFPLIGITPKNRRLARKGYRILIIDNYLVFYVLLNDEVVEIRRIISGKRNYKFLL